MTIVEKIVKTAPITIVDNYKTRLEARANVLSKRRKNLNKCRSRGAIEFENGVAVRFYPAVRYRKDFDRLDRMIKVIDAELREINRYLK